MTGRAVTFDCFGTLVAVDRPADPGAAVADELRTRGVTVPADWRELYATPHVDVDEGAELSLSAHVAAALAAGGVDAAPETVHEAVLTAFDQPAEPRAGAAEAVAAVSGAVGVLSNCSVPGLVERTLDRAGLDGFDAVTVSVDCGWRKPDRRAFAAAADALGTTPGDLVHVGDDPEADGGVEAVGGRFVDVDETPLGVLPDRLEGGV